MRFRRAGGEERQQIKWVAWAAGLSVFFIPVYVLPTLARLVGRELGFLASVKDLVLGVWAICFVLAIGIAVLRHRLFDIDLVLNRTLVYGSLTVLLAVTYLAGVFLAQRAFTALTGGESEAAIVLSTLAMASMFHPFRSRIQWLVDRVLGHGKSDPSALIAQLGERLEDTRADLQRSRERLVLAREEERRRLRRDLHDGLGPQLAALILQVGTLPRLIRSQPAAATGLPTEVQTELRWAIADIRRLVYDLRPPALDELGLVVH